MVPISVWEALCSGVQCQVVFERVIYEGVFPVRAGSSSLAMTELAALSSVQFKRSAREFILGMYGAGAITLIPYCL